MKRFIAFLLVFGVVLSATSAFAVYSSAISGKTTVGINYLAWGTFTGITVEARSVTTGLSAIRAFGASVNSTEAYDASTSEVYAQAVGGKIYLKSGDATARGGSWWAIGR